MPVSVAHPLLVGVSSEAEETRKNEGSGNRNKRDEKPAKTNARRLHSFHRMIQCSPARSNAGELVILASKGKF
jgi:hypothetical protein